MAIKIKLVEGKVLLPLNNSQGGIRIADENGNHVSSPTQTENINKFMEDSEFSKRETIKIKRKQLDKFEGFEIYSYTENFSSFEKTLPTKVIARITFKLGDYGLDPHPHMYVLIPFNLKSLKIKNFEGCVNPGSKLGKKCFGEWIPTDQDVGEIITALGHASENHKSSLIELIKG